MYYPNLIKEEIKIMLHISKQSSAIPISSIFSKFKKYDKKTTIASLDNLFSQGFIIYHNDFENIDTSEYKLLYEITRNGQIEANNLKRHFFYNRFDFFKWIVPNILSVLALLISIYK